MRYIIVLISFTLCAQFCAAQDIVVHDPVMIKQDDTYFLFYTGFGISVSSSTDMKTWTKQKPVFDVPPTWAVNAVPGFKGHIWAPDISFHNGEYYLYYSISAFGKNTSCIGLATNVTLNVADKNYKWIDHGKVIESIPGRDLWNAIDPNLIMDDSSEPWLVFGSFWQGIKLVKMNLDLDRIAEPQQWYTLASRPRDFKVDERDAGEAAIEAPFIFRKNNYYYLFVSFDYCCRGAESTYKIMVGRSEKIQGPYLDSAGMPMHAGGGSVVLQGNKHWAGVGHCAAYTFNDTDYLIFHAYDMNDGGKPKFKLRKMTWNNLGWPEVEGL
jgi:arabinan endo-1,5-alpha-L-arabinosidase